MSGRKDKEEDAHHQGLEDVKAQLRPIFEKFTNEIPLLLFTTTDSNEPFNRGTRQIIRALMELSQKIILHEFDLAHKEARKWKAVYSPTLLFDPEHYKVRWYGAPLGEEARTFVEAMIMIGYGRTNLGVQAKKILDRMKDPRDVKVFVSTTCPYCPQQAVNALKAAIEKPELITLEIIDIQANPRLAGKYSAQSVPQVYANEKLIAMGAQTEDLFMLSLEKMEEQTFFIPDSDAEEVATDLLVVGGGPSGLTAGIYGARSGLRTAIIERNILGGQVASTPVVENYPRITQIGGKALVDLMVTHALEYVNIFPGEEVIEVKPGDTIKVLTSRRRFNSRALLLATGAEHRHLNVPGESRLSGHGVSYCSTCDGPLFKEKKVIMAGGGDSAVTEALHLNNIGVDVTVVHRRERLRAQEHLTRSLSASNVKVLFNKEIVEIRGRDSVEGVELLDNQTGETSIIPADGVFIAIGYSPSTELAKKIGLEITSDGYIKHDSRHRTSIRGIYSAGDVEGGYKQIVTAAGRGSDAALAIFEDLVNPYWKKENL